jgi:hypothetical protein
MINNIDYFSDKFAPKSNLSRKNDREVMNWCDRHIKRGMSYLKNNRGWRTADTCLSILLGDTQDEMPVGMSDLYINKNRRMLREGIATKSNIRPRWGYKTFNTDELVQNQTKTLNNLLESWYYTNFIDRTLRGSLQYSDGAGTGYLHLCIEVDKNTGHPEIMAKYLSHKDVLVAHPTADLDLQKAKAVMIRHEMSLPEAQKKFWHCKDIIIEDRKQPSWIYKKSINIASKLHLIDNIKRDKSQQLEAIYPTVDIWEIFIQDETVNITGKPIVMCQYSDPYIVPSYYDNEGNVNQVDSGVKNPDGTTLYIDISIEDCKLYPNRRRIFYCTGGILSDDGSPYWFDGVPLVQFKTDDIVGEFLGLSTIHDAYKVEKSANSVLRAWEDSINGKLAPPLAIDSRIPKQIAKKFNMRLSIGQKFRYNILAMAKAFLPLIPPEYYSFDSRGHDFIKFLHESMDYLTGTKDLTAIFNQRQLPAGDTQEAFLQSIGPLAADQSRGIEFSLLKLGMIWKPLAFQTYTYRKRLTILGKDNKFEDLDYDPDSLIPYRNENSDIPKWKRAKNHMSKFYFYAAPNSLHERESMTRQLKYFQMKKLMMPIPDRVIYENMTGESDYTQLENEYYAQETKKAVTAAKIQGLVQMVLQQVQSEMNPLGSAISALTGQQGGNGSNGLNGANNGPLNKSNPVGRPNDNETAPRLTTTRDENGIPSGVLETSDNN